MHNKNKIIVVLLIIYFILFSSWVISYGVENENINEIIKNDNNTTNEIIEANMQNTSNIKNTSTDDIKIDTNNSDVTLDFLDEYKSKKYEFEMWYNSLKDYLNDYGLFEENLRLMSTVSVDSNFGKVVGKIYYLRYQGHVFSEPIYIIFFDKDGHVLKATYIEFKYEQILPNVSTLSNRYQALTKIELQQDLDTTIYNVFDYYNYFTSIENFRNYVKKCEFSKTELEDKIDMLQRMYDSYLVDKKNEEPKKKYTKKQLLDVYNEFIQELKSKEDEYISEMLRKNHIEGLQSKLKEVEPYTEEYARNMIENDHINKSNVKSKKIVNEIPNSGSEANRYIVVLSGIILISILGIILFVFVQKTKKNSKV